VAFSIDYEVKSEAWRTGYAMSTAATLSLVARDGIPVDAIPKTRSWPGAFEDGGLITVDQIRGRLTTAGERLHADNVARLDEVESDWRMQYGTDRVDELSSTLGGIVAGLNDTLPDHVLVVFAPGVGFTVVDRC